MEPRGGENLRGRGRAGASAPCVMLNSSKQAVTLNLEHPQGKALLEGMAARSDVVVENFRPGVMAALGLSPDHLRALNPPLTIQAMSGTMAVTGFGDREPVKAGPAVGDNDVIYGGWLGLSPAEIRDLADRAVI